MVCFLFNSKGYNSLILPQINSTQPIIVKMTLQLVLLINVDEKDQVISDQRLIFDP